MKYGVYSIRDLQAGWLTPTIDYNDGTAKRNFAHAIMQKNTLMYSHAQDYDLFKIGEFDTENGTISPIYPNELIQSGQGVVMTLKDGE